MRTLLAGLLGATLLAAGCQQPPAPPVSVAEYDRLAEQGRQTYTRWTIFLYNLRRGMDPLVSQEARTLSLDLARRLAQEDPTASECFSAAASDLVSMVPPNAQAGTPGNAAVLATPRAGLGFLGQPR